jgi:hypothetical protein
MDGTAENDARRHNEVPACDTACAAQGSIAAGVSGSVAASQNFLISRQDDHKQPADSCNCSECGKWHDGGIPFPNSVRSAPVGNGSLWM